MAGSRCSFSESNRIFGKVCFAMLSKRSVLFKGIVLCLTALLVLTVYPGLQSASAAASGPPGAVVISHTHWNNDGNYKIEMNMWWGNNGTSWKLYENGKLVHEEELKDNSPQAQHAFKEFTKKSGGTYTYKAELINSYGSVESNEVKLQVPGEGEVPDDDEPPTAPQNLRLDSKTANTVSLKWDASQDNIGVAGYNVYRNDVKIATVQTNSYRDTGLKSDTEYDYFVESFDTKGNTSKPSNKLVVRTSKNGDDGNEGPRQKVIAYYPSWATYGRDYQIADIDASKVTHINYAFSNIANGEMVLGDSYADTDKAFPGDCWEPGCKRGNFNQLNKLKQKHPHVKTLISVGGWTWSNNFSDVALTDASRSKFADSAVRFVREYGFDGVDVDWEYPVEGGLVDGRPEDKQNFTLLLKKMKEKLDDAGKEDGKDYLLTIATGANPKYVQNTELDKVQAQLDWINIMTYDFHGGWDKVSGNNAPLYFDPDDPSSAPETSNVDAAVEGHLKAGVPKEKLVLGLPFYGRGWDGCAEANNGQYQLCSGPAREGTWEPGIFDFSHLEKDYINKNGYTRYWNDKAKVPYLYNPATKTFISYDDEESIGYKTGYIKSKGLAGAMFWELSSDRNGTLLNKVYNDLK